MKIRKGFVSNSSSSSFIIALDRPWEDLDVSYIKEAFHLCYKEQADVILRDLQGCVSGNGSWGIKIDPTDPALMERLLAEEDCPYHVAHRDPEYHRIDRELWDDPWDPEEPKEARQARVAPLYKALHDRGDELHKELLQRFLAENAGKHLYRLSYSDNDGQISCDLEHGDHWYHVSCIAYNHH
jgi:hypothetical protein